MDDGVKDRVRVQLSREAAVCPRCERPELRLMRSRDTRAGLAKVNPFWDAHEKVYERCKVCGFRRAVAGSAATRHAEVATSSRERRPVLTALGWTAVVLMIVLIAVLAVVLAGMLLVVSVWLTVAVPLVVLLVVVGVAAYARRS